MKVRENKDLEKFLLQTIENQFETIKQLRISKEKWRQKYQELSNQVKEPFMPNLEENLEIIEEEPKIPSELGDFEFGLSRNEITTTRLNDLCCTGFNKMYTKINEIITYLEYLAKEDDKK